MRGRATTPQHTGERLVGRVEVGEHRVKPEPGAVIHRRAFFLGMRVDERRVDIDHDPRGAHTQSPRALACTGARRAQRVKQRGLTGDPVDQPKRRRVRRDRAEQRRLIPHRPQVRQTVTAVGEHHRKIANHSAGVMPTAALTHARQRGRERAGETEPVSDLAQQRGTRVGDQALSVRRDIYREIAPIALHLQGEPPEQILRTSNTHRITAQADSPAAPTYRGRNCS